jgi:hypothetical protein
MGYDPKAVRVKKADKAIAILTYNKDRERHFIREMAQAEAKNNRAKSAKNRGAKEE